MEKRYISISHSGEGKITSRLEPLLTQTNATFHRFVGKGTLGKGLLSGESQRLIRTSSMLIIEMSDNSCSNGDCANAEKVALEIAAHAAIPCVLIASNVSFARFAQYLKHPIIKNGVRAFIVEDSVTKSGEEELLQCCPKASIVRFRPQTAPRVATMLNELAEQYNATTTKEPFQCS